VGAGASFTSSSTGHQKEEKPESPEFKKFKGKSKGDGEREKKSSRKIRVVIYFLEKE
jgi:hypothetical protein